MQRKEKTNNVDEHYKNLLDAVIQKNAANGEVTREIVKSSRKEVKRLIKKNPWHVLVLKTQLTKLRKFTSKQSQKTLDEAFDRIPRSVFGKYKIRYLEIQSKKLSESDRAMQVRDLILDLMDEVQNKVRADPQVKWAFSSPHMEEVLAARIELQRQYLHSYYENWLKDGEDEDQGEDGNED